jgi:hypothetical protein
MTEKSCSRCGECCKVLPLFTHNMHPKYREYLLNRGLVEDKEQGCILIPHVCQYLKCIPENRFMPELNQGKYSCDIHDDPRRPSVCKKFHGQRMIQGSKIYIPPQCSYKHDRND